MPEPRVQVTDFEEEPFLADGIAILSSAFKSWATAEGEGTRQLWSMLGQVYELGARVERSGAAKLDLIKRVNADPNVQDSPKWNPSKKTACELLLVTLLSIKEETKAKKSQWFSAIRAAEKAQTRPTQSDFVVFLESAGGIDGARKLHAKPRNPKLTYDELVQRALDLVDPNIDPTDKITTPDFFGETPDLPGEMGLVVVHGERAGGKAVRIATIADEKLIARCIEFLLKGKKSYDADRSNEIAEERKAAIVEMNKFMRKQRAPYRKEKKEFRGPHQFPTFAEYVARKADDDEATSRLKTKYPNEYETFLRNIPQR